MLLSKYLLISEKFKNHIEVLKGLKQNVLPEGSFLLCVNSSSQNLMDIYSIKEFERPHVKKDNLLIIAICTNKKDAREKCANIFGGFVAEHKSLNGFKEKFCETQDIVGE